MTLTPQFGIFLVPMANNPDELFQQAKIADHNGLDLLCSFRIIPTPAAFLRDLDAAERLAMKTERIHISPGVADQKNDRFFRYKRFDIVEQLNLFLGGSMSAHLIDPSPGKGVERRR